MSLWNSKISHFLPNELLKINYNGFLEIGCDLREKFVREPTQQTTAEIRSTQELRYRQTRVLSREFVANELDTAMSIRNSKMSRFFANELLGFNSTFFFKIGAISPENSFVPPPDQTMTEILHLADAARPCGQIHPVYDGMRAHTQPRDLSPVRSVE